MEKGVSLYCLILSLIFAVIAYALLAYGHSLIWSGAGTVVALVAVVYLWLSYALIPHAPNGHAIS